MPEGDVVWRTAARLDAALTGHDLVAADLRWPSLATLDLRGRPVLGVVSAGKHLLIRLGGATELTLHSHLRMEGSWHVHATGQPWRSARSVRDVRAVLVTAPWTAVGHRLGMLDVVPTPREHELVGHLGPDVLGPDWDPALATANLLARREREVGDALLDQRVLAGIGTFFMSEALFLLGVTPWTPVGELPDVGRLVELAHRLLVAGCTQVSQTTTGDTRPSARQWVHSRSGRPCRRCGTGVRVAMIGTPPHDRTAFYCPHCQRGPAPTDDGRAQVPLGASTTRRSRYRSGG